MMNEMNLKETAVYLGLQPETVRRLLIKGRIKATKDNLDRWQVLPTEADKYNASKNTKTKGTLAYVVYIPRENVEDIKAYLQSMNIRIRRKNVKRQKPNE